MKLHRYKEFTNEGIISKGLELINYRVISKNDKIAKKYLDMIYTDYAKKKSLFAVSILESDKYFKLSYKISDEPFGSPNEISGGNYVVITISSIRKFGWSEDITRARIEITKSNNHREEMLVGRDINTNKTIYDENGIDRNSYKYINISQSQVDKMIQFFKNEYITKYPNMEGEKYLNKTSLLIKNKVLSNHIKQYHKIEMAKDEEEFNTKFKEFEYLINKNLFYTKEEILDYIIDVSDYFIEMAPRFEMIWTQQSKNGLKNDMMDIGYNYDIQNQGKKYVSIRRNVKDDEHNGILEPNTGYYLIRYFLSGDIDEKEREIEEETNKIDIGLPSDLEIIYYGIPSDNDFKFSRIFDSGCFCILIQQL